TVAAEGTDFGTLTKPDGSYELELGNGGKQTLVFSNLSFELEKKTIRIASGERYHLDVSLRKKATTLTEFIKKDDASRYQAGSIQIQAKKASELPSTIGGIEGLIKTFVGSNNE